MTDHTPSTAPSSASSPSGPTSREFDHVDLTGARFHRVQLNDARFRMVDLTGAVLRDVSLEGAEIDGEVDGLTINGVEVGAYVEAELARRTPARALRRATDPAGLREAWAAIEQAWQASYDRVAALPAGTTELSVEGEWTYTQTLRHLVMATDGWLGAILGEEHPFHPWGLAFTEIYEFVDGAERLGLDHQATPTYDEVREVRADRVARVRAFLADVTPERLAEPCAGPQWQSGEDLGVLRCFRVILNEECEHLRYAERDLDLLEAGHPRTTPPLR